MESHYLQGFYTYQVVVAGFLNQDIGPFFSKSAWKAGWVSARDIVCSLPRFFSQSKSSSNMISKTCPAGNDSEVAAKFML